MIHHDEHKNLFLSFKDPLSGDTTIADDSLVGVVRECEKVNILNDNSFAESIPLANLLTCRITQTDNKLSKKSILEIDDSYVNSFTNSKEKINYLSNEADNQQLVFLN